MTIFRHPYQRVTIQYNTIQSREYLLKNGGLVLMLIAASIQIVRQLLEHDMKLEKSTNDEYYPVLRAVLGKKPEEVVDTIHGMVKHRLDVN